MRDFIPIPPKDHFSISHKITYNLFTQPSSILILQEKRKIPMIERDGWFDAVLQTGINHVFIMLERNFIDSPLPKGKDSRPRNRERIIRNAHRRNPRDIYFQYQLLVFKTRDNPKKEETHLAYKDNIHYSPHLRYRY